MADFTRKAIIDTYISMIERMPASQVTVSALVKECGINRNTFYYHFRDIPDLLETIAETDADSIISWVVTFGEGAELTGPEELRQRLADCWYSCPTCWDGTK